VPDPRCRCVPSSAVRSNSGKSEDASGTMVASYGREPNRGAGRTAGRRVDAVAKRGCSSDWFLSRRWSRCFGEEEEPPRLPRILGLLSCPNFGTSGTRQSVAATLLAYEAAVKGSGIAPSWRSMARRSLTAQRSTIRSAAIRYMNAVPRSQWPAGTSKPRKRPPGQ
jgi:hypothetical protein